MSLPLSFITLELDLFLCNLIISQLYICDSNNIHFISEIGVLLVAVILVSLYAIFFDFQVKVSLILPSFNACQVYEDS